MDDLKSFRFGLGLVWIDVGILRANGFQVVTGSNYDGPFRMLAAHRFDTFLRSAVEVLGELDQHKAAFPDFVIESNIILYYPMPMYFWFPGTDEGRKLARRAEEGMRHDRPLTY